MLSPLPYESFRGVSFVAVMMIASLVPELAGEGAAAAWNKPPSCCGCGGLLGKAAAADALAGGAAAADEAAGTAAAHGKVGAAWLPAACRNQQCLNRCSMFLGVHGAELI